MTSQCICPLSLIMYTSDIFRPFQRSEYHRLGHPSSSVQKILFKFSFFGSISTKNMLNSDQKFHKASKTLKQKDETATESVFMHLTT